MDKYYSYNVNNSKASYGIASALMQFYSNSNYITTCIGTDLVLADSLGPLTGTFLREKNPNSYLYGTLTSPITAKEVFCANSNLSKIHPNSKIIAIDAAVGNECEVGLIKIFNKGLKPGLGVNKELDIIGDISIIGIVAGKSIDNYNLYNNTRLNLIYKMAETISNGVSEFLNEIHSNKCVNSFSA